MLLQALKETLLVITVFQSLPYHTSGSPDFSFADSCSCHTLACRSL